MRLECVDERQLGGSSTPVNYFDYVDITGGAAWYVLLANFNLNY
jgi:hypothetical protein